MILDLYFIYILTLEIKACFSGGRNGFGKWYRALYLLLRMTL